MPIVPSRQRASLPAQHLTKVLQVCASFFFSHPGDTSCHLGALKSNQENMARGLLRWSAKCHSRLQALPLFCVDTSDGRCAGEHAAAFAADKLSPHRIKMSFATRHYWRPPFRGEPARPPVPIACNTKESGADHNTNQRRVNQHGDRQRKSDHLDH